MKKMGSCFVIVLTILFVTVIPVMADVLFNNPSRGAISPSASSISQGFVSWDDFNLLSNSFVNSISYRGWTFPGYVVTQVDWAIFSDANGTPGTMLFSGTASTAGTAVGYQGNNYYDVRDYVFSVRHRNLSSGVYWLALDNAVGTGAHGYLWEINTNSSGTYTPRNSLQNLPPQLPVPREYDLVFSVNGAPAHGHHPVPEPSVLFLLGSGLAGLIGFRRKFKK